MNVVIGLILVVIGGVLLFFGYNPDPNVTGFVVAGWITVIIGGAFISPSIIDDLDF